MAGLLRPNGPKIRAHVYLCNVRCSAGNVLTDGMEEANVAVVRDTRHVCNSREAYLGETLSLMRMLWFPICSENWALTLHFGVLGTHLRGTPHPTYDIGRHDR